jgi:outer membrane cobalamin receptor
MWRFAILSLLLSAAMGQRNTGELRIQIFDSSGAALAAKGSITGLATQIHREFETDSEGRLVARSLPYGHYRVEVHRTGFVTQSAIVQIESSLPVQKRFTLGVAASGAEVIVVTDAATLVDPHRTGPVQYIGGDRLRDRPASQPGRSILDAVNQQPGWLLEANGVLHPRGAEYDTQYVVDGMPLTENRSPAFAPEIEAEDVQALSVLTGNYPAEYGRKLGGVVEVTTRRDDRPGFHGKMSAHGGSFDTAGAFAGLQYARGANAFGVSAEGAVTDRYLDPPVTQNFSNAATISGIASRFERDFSDRNRLRLSVTNRRARFLVPNELLQEQAGQRQDRTSGETAGQVSYQHIFSAAVLGNVRAMVRDLAAELWSNPLSTPISATQQRGIRESYVNASLSAHAGDHELKAGAEASFANLNERFGYDISAYRIAGIRIFDSDTPPEFRFAGSGGDREQSAFVQDLMRKGRFTLSAGLRWDHYSLRVRENALSPRLGAAWLVPAAGLVLRASYDRVFQTPAAENLLLSSSDAIRTINEKSIFLPVRPSRGNFYEVGFSKNVRGRLRVDGQFFRRDLDHFADDDLLLNTGVSFPVTFSHAVIHGFEAKVEMPRWGPVSGFASYSNMSGKAQLPVTGGLFLDDNASALLSSSVKLPITQDQRNTVSTRVRSDVGNRAWFAAGAGYGSGLPIELESINLPLWVQQYGEATINRVNFDRGRVRPQFTFDASAGVRLLMADRWSARLQADGFNLTNHLNVINFAGLFSGTAISRPRSATIRLQLDF